MLSKWHYLYGHYHMHKDHGILRLIWCKWSIVTTNIEWEEWTYNCRAYSKTVQDTGI
jgi:hypothetical protein